jgi:hypothetical protein
MVGATQPPLSSSKEWFEATNQLDIVTGKG